MSFIDLCLCFNQYVTVEKDCVKQIVTIKFRKVLELYPVNDRLYKFNISYGNVLLLCAWNAWMCSLIICYYHCVD